MPLQQPNTFNSTTLSDELDHNLASGSHSFGSTIESHCSLNSPGPDSVVDSAISLSITQPSQEPPTAAAPNEVLGMLSFLRELGKGHSTTAAILTVTGTVSMPLLADTFGWLQQDSDENQTLATGSSSAIPLKEQDDPPDAGME